MVTGKRYAIDFKMSDGSTKTVEFEVPVVEPEGLEYMKIVGNPRNLLDNSDFRNPVNQRGQVSYTCGIKTTQTIDRWQLASEGATVTVEDGYISKSASMSQKIAGLDRSKTYTAVVCSKDGTVSTISGMLANQIGSWYHNVFVYTSEEDEDMAFFAIPERGPSEVIWAALYEGEHTAETLPEYKPKGYAAELAECQRYYLPDGEYSWSIMHVASGYAFCSIKLPVTMRVIPSIIENPKKKFMVYNNGWTEIDLSLFTTLYLQPGEMTFMVSMSQITNLQLESGKSYLISGIPALSADL